MRAARTVAGTFALLLAGPTAAASQDIASGVTPETVFVDVTFRGAALTVFGAVRSETRQEGLDGADVAIVVRGPGGPLEVRAKRRLAGLWVNDAPVRLTGAPGYVHIAATRDLDAVADAETRARWSLGLDNLDVAFGEGAERLDADARARAVAALIAQKRRAGLYEENAGGVRVVDETYFQVSLNLPANAPVGRYDVDTLFIRDGAVVDSHVRRFVVERFGIERAVFEFAQDHPTAYGLAALIISLGAGFLASVVFRRR